MHFAAVFERQAVGQRLGDRLYGEVPAGVADFIDVPVAGGDADAEPVNSQRAEIECNGMHQRNVIGARAGEQWKYSACSSGVTETAAQEKADGKFFRFLRNRPGSLEGFCIFEVVHER